LVLLTYNKSKVKAEEAPKNWTDLLDPKWKGKVSTGHPAFSGYVGTWVLTMRKLYGWSFFDKLEKNKPQIGRSINDTVTALNAGERQVAAGADGSTLFSAARGNPLAISYPTDGAVLIIAPSAIVKGTKHPNAAKLFMEYLYSVEAARINAKHFGVPLRPEVPAPPGARPVAEVKTVRPSVAEIDKGIPEVIEQWRDTFGN
jgi:iron(III) transport system substrate-binding protein